MTTYTITKNGEPVSPTKEVLAEIAKLVTFKIRYKYSRDDTPDQKLWDNGWRVSYGFKLFGFHFLKYEKV